MIPCLTMNTARAKMFLYPKKPFYSVKPVVCVSNEISIDSLPGWQSLFSITEKVGIFHGSAFQKR